MALTLTIIEENGLTFSDDRTTITVGASGPQGATGQGVPAGGTTGQVLAKASGTNYDTEWVTGGGGGGSGDVVGPASSVDGRAALFDGITGKLIKQATAAPVLEGDARLTDARTPTSHAATHQDGGSDELALDASQVTSGTVATARLGTGTASSGTYLRGDQTYAQPVVSAYYVTARHYYPPGVVSGGTRSVASGAATATPYPIYRPVSVDGLQVDLSAANGAGQSIDLHVMSVNASGDPDASVFTVNVTTTGSGTQVLSATGTPVALSPGLYYVVVHNRSANALTARSAAAGCNIPPIPASTSTSANQFSGWLKTPGTSAITSYPAVTAVTDNVNQSPLVAMRFT